MATFHPSLCPPSHKFNFFSFDAFASDDHRSPVLLFQSLVYGQPARPKVLGYRGARIGGRMLDVGPIDVLSGELQVDLDRLPGVTGIPHNQAADDVHIVRVNMFYSLDGRV